MGFAEVIHHGALDGVTGSCHELLLGHAGVLVDCGLFQGHDIGPSGRSSPEIDFPVAHIKALLLTHVHLDHCGRLPYLLAAGFKGPIYCSVPSAHLLCPVIEDALKVGVTRNKRLIKQFLQQIKKQLMPIPYGQWQKVEVAKGLDFQIKAKPAGHILGSAYFECRVRSSTRKEKRIVFSGDLGAPYAPLLPVPKSPYGADLVVLEATYGDRLHHGRKERRAALRRVVEKSLRDRGVVLIPAFSIGRTQELLYELEEIINRYGQSEASQGLPWDDLEIIVDSPLAARFTELYRQMRPYWDREALAKIHRGRHPLSFEQLTTIENHADHLYSVEYLQKKVNPCVVLAASGMCSGGRIVNYLKKLIGDKRTDIVFVGYQAVGTPGRTIQQYAPSKGYVVFDGQKHTIRAGVHTISGYSAHADQKDLLNFIKRMRRRPKAVHLVHGERGAKLVLAERLRQLGIEKIIL